MGILTGWAQENMPAVLASRQQYKIRTGSVYA
jgi:hypothetical protein